MFPSLPFCFNDPNGKIRSMQNPASFFKHRAGAAFHRRRKYPIKSEDWLREVNEARRFIRYYRGILESEARERLTTAAEEQNAPE